MEPSGHGLERYVALESTVGRGTHGLQRWLAPASLLLSALFFQNAGLYSASCEYVRWTDEAVASVAGRVSSIEEEAQLALEDPVHGLLKSSKLARSLEGLSWSPEIWVDLMADCVILLLLWWLVRKNDLKTWTHLALSASVLAVLKGFLAWSTVLPNAAGWGGCKQSLGADGLMYFRRQNTGSLSLMDSLLDITLLTIQSLWLLGRAAPQQLCSDTLFCCSTSSLTLVCLSAYEAVARSVDEFRHERRAAVMGLFGLILCAIVLADITLAIGSKLHYSLDVVAAVPLSFLVYGNPALALMAQDWADTDVATSEVPTEALRFPPDLGIVSVAPCCLPFADLAGTYYLQDRDWDFGPFSWTAERQRQHYRRKSEIQATLEATRRRCEDISLLVQNSKRAAERVLEEKREEMDRRVSEVHNMQERELADAKSALEVDREAVAALKLKLASTSTSVPRGAAS
ncbi:unnamed protein product [Symbiodinium natans]|uniref:Sphingomyelin synthase-like domain-containing protein n=1 Tax=Symbiodinium natans TaxID=878477 RepID=A0A812R2Q4_9DINO|nr:unnamed protein product [Symbiodinium natans]